MGEVETAVKTAARIRHNKLDDEIARLIDAATTEMIRAGVDEKAARGDDPLIIQAKVTYCLMNLTEDPNLIDKYNHAFEIQLDGLRKSLKYCGGDDNV